MPASIFSSRPLVSVVMATFNGGRFIREQMDSILSQTYPSLEVIVVDDASDDNTLSILNEYTAHHPQVKVFPAEANMGFLKNFERGIRLCEGAFIALSDQDDIWLPAKIETLMAQRGNHPLVYCNSELIDGEGKKINIKLTDLKNLLDFDSPINYTVGGTASGHAMLVRRDVALASFPWPPMVTHDYWLGFVATLFGPLKFVDQVLVLYRQHNANVIGVSAGSLRATRKKKRTKAEKHQLIRERMRLMYEKCPDTLVEEKRFFLTLSKSYEDFSLSSNFTRMITFMKYRDKITAYKKRNALRRIFFCLKMFTKIE
jgi:glycosyltransferase involved in cell wall biosynthesis